jgi:hypothetical protein
MLRIILLIVFLVIAVVAFYIGIRAVLDTEPGWETVECASGEVNCSSDFIFSYCYGQTEENPSVEKKRLSNLYAQLATDAWRIFNTDVLTLNEQVNTPVAVDPALYDALALFDRYDSRYLFLAPVYSEYAHMFIAQSDVEATDYDPAQNPQQAAYLAGMAAFAADPAMVDIELLDNNQVKLVVAEEYLAFAKGEDISHFVDFGWMTNGFIADYLAEKLIENGFTNGFVASYDGFTRNLDTRGEQFSLNLFNRQGTSIYLAGTMQYNRPISIVSLRDYPMSQKDQFHYYAFESGHLATTMADPADGMYKSATDSLVCYSYDLGCAEILLQQSAVYVADALDEAALADMKENGISSIWFDGLSLCCNDEELTILLNGKAGLEYSLEYVK